jgi:hypothetical protein
LQQNVVLLSKKWLVYPDIWLTDTGLAYPLYTRSDGRAVAHSTKGKGGVMMTLFEREIDPYKWRLERAKGKRIYLINHGILSALAAGVAYAAFMAVFGNVDVYFNGVIFMLLTLPVYVFMAYVRWETNEEAFASWVVEEHARLRALGKTNPKRSA